MQRCAALNKEHLVVIGNAHQVAEILLGLVDDLLEDLGTMRHFHDAHTGAAVVQKLITNLLKNRNGHRGRTGGEVKSAIVHGCTSCQNWAFARATSSIRRKTQIINHEIKKIFRFLQNFFMFDDGEHKTVCCNAVQHTVLSKSPRIQFRGRRKAQSSRWAAATFCGRLSRQGVRQPERQTRRERVHPDADRLAGSQSPEVCSAPC